MNKNKTEKFSQNAESKSDQTTPEKNKEIQDKKPAENDPTPNDKPLLIISKL